MWQPGQRRCRRGQALVWGASPTSVHQLRERVAGAGLPVTVSDRVPVVPLSLRLHDNIASSAASDPAGLSGGLAASHAAARARFRAVAAKGELVEQCEQLRGGPQAKTLRGVMMLVRTYAGVGSKWTVPELHQGTQNIQMWYCVALLLTLVTLTRRRWQAARVGDAGGVGGA